jgi:hypothetical protein
MHYCHFRPPPNAGTKPLDSSTYNPLFLFITKDATDHKLWTSAAFSVLISLEEVAKVRALLANMRRGESPVKSAAAINLPKRYADLPSFRRKKTST